MSIGVYTIQHTTSKRFYVGSSVNVEKRMVTHRYKLRHKKHHCKHLQNAWCKYTEFDFVFKLQCVVDSEAEAREIEQAMLDVFYADTYNTKNTALGGAIGDANPMRNPEVAKKISDGRKGMVFTSEHRKNLSESKKGSFGYAKGLKHTNESKAKMRLAKLGKTSPRKGVVLSDEVKARMSAAKTGIKKGPYKVIVCEHCGKTGAGGAMRQWHGNNCKNKGSTK
jgi:group I intron endonuclease